MTDQYDDALRLADQAVENDSPYARSPLSAALVYAVLALTDQVERIADVLEVA